MGSRKLDIPARNHSKEAERSFMLETKIFDTESKPTAIQKNELVDFLFDNLQQYGDPKAYIRKAIDFSIKEINSFGGFTIQLSEKGEIKGVVVVNQTGMGGYIPENILVYIAIHNDHRGEGLGRKLMQEAIDFAKGDIALHVEADNPARFLYENLGFTNPYIEMRLKR
jgi:ribosomal-protein-alanine N-acetyltransferase